MKRTVLLGFFLVFLCFPLVLRADILQLTAYDFQVNDPDEADVWYSANGMVYAESGSTYRDFYASLPDLPHLGVIDQMRIYYYDDDVGYIRVRLIRRKVSDNSEEVLADWQSTGEASFQRQQDVETFTLPTIKNKGYRYYIRVFFSSSTAGGSIDLRGIRFRYYPPGG